MAMLLLLPMDTMEEDMLVDNHTTFMSIIIQSQQHQHRHQHLHQLWNQLQKAEKQQQQLQQRKIVIKI